MPTIPERPTLEGLDERWSEAWEANGTYCFDRTRERAERRLWATLPAAPTPTQAKQLQQLVVVPTGKRLSELDRLRRRVRQRDGGSGFSCSGH